VRPARIVRGASGARREAGGNSRARIAGILRAEKTRSCRRQTGIVPAVPFPVFRPPHAALKPAAPARPQDTGSIPHAGEHRPRGAGGMVAGTTGHCAAVRDVFAALVEEKRILPVITPSGCTTRCSTICGALPPTTVAARRFPIPHGREIVLRSTKSLAISGKIDRLDTGGPASRLRDRL